MATMPHSRNWERYVGYGAARRVRTGCAGATLAHEPCCKANERINSTERHVGGYKEYDATHVPSICS